MANELVRLVGCDAADAWILASTHSEDGPTARIAQTYPMPRCADPSGYWRKYLAVIRAGSHVARVGGNRTMTMVRAVSAMKDLK